MQKSKQFEVLSAVTRSRRKLADLQDDQLLEAKVVTWGAPTGVALRLPAPTGIDLYVCAHEHNSLIVIQWGESSVEVRIPSWALHVPEDGSEPAPVVLKSHSRELTLTDGDIERKITAKLVLNGTSPSGVVLELRANGKRFVVRPNRDGDDAVDIGLDGQVHVPAGALSFAA